MILSKPTYCIVSLSVLKVKNNLTSSLGIMTSIYNLLVIHTAITCITYLTELLVNFFINGQPCMAITTHSSSILKCSTANILTC